MKNIKQNFDSLEKKFGKLDTALYKSFDKYHEKCKDLADFLIKNVISDYDEDKVYSFYVEYKFSDGLVLNIDLEGMSYRAVVCGVNAIFELFRKEQRKLSLKEIIDKTSS